MTLVNVIAIIIAIAIFVGAGYAMGRYMTIIKYASKAQETFDKGVEYGLEKTRWLVANGYIVLMNGRFIETSKFVALKQQAEESKEDK